MSLAMYAAPFDSDVVGVSETPITRKRNEHQKTQKRYSKYEENTNSDPYNSERVNSILKKIHNLPEYDDLTNFEPIPPPESAGVEKTADSTSSSPENTSSQPNTSSEPYSESAMPFSSSSPSKEGFQMRTKNGEYQGYNPQNRFLPNYDTMYSNQNLPYGSTKNKIEKVGSLDKNELLMQKLNYMISLLEQQQDQRTNHVTEEVILYSFLGIFIIFIVDSFARVGKYVR